MSAPASGSGFAQLPLPSTSGAPQKRAAAALYNFAGLLRCLVKAIVNRREVARLGELDDRMLKDIGLVRSDVLGALSEPIHHDPSVMLVVRSVERRAAAAERARNSLRRAMVKEAVRPQSAASCTLTAR